MESGASSRVWRTPRVFQKAKLEIFSSCQGTHFSREVFASRSTAQPLPKYENAAFPFALPLCMEDMVFMEVVRQQAARCVVQVVQFSEQSGRKKCFYGREVKVK